ncbi:MAG: hypothetical protein K6T83_01155 [Alicyclobacillus sp.]|nr:hypothetical protein [Alicyclobacillus sp.]
MTDTVMTMKQLEDFFQSWTSQILGTSDPSAVRINWPTDGAPGWKITDDVCFLAISPTDDAYTRQLHIDYSELDEYNANADLAYTATFRVTWTFYGPNAADRADLVRSQLFTPAATSAFVASNLALVTDVAMPYRFPELFNGQWWNRATFNATFNELVIRQSSVPYIQTVNLQTQEG